MGRASRFPWVVIVLLSTFTCVSVGQDMDAKAVRAEVDFSKHLREWDGFGVNYVELAQSRDYAKDPQEYGGFSRLSESKRQEILDLVFGEDGLKPGVVKMFFDPFHQKTPNSPFDHETTTRWMRYFVREGLRKTRARGGDLEIITTLYGPPAWATQQKILRGRDLDMSQKHELALYMIDWVKYLKEEEGFPVKYLSFHNEGDSPGRWPLDGRHGNIGKGHDYNAFWRPWQVADFLAFMRPMMDAAGLRDVGLTPGECTTWGHFERHWYHWAIYDNADAIRNIGLVTSHGFGASSVITSQPKDLLNMKRPDLHAWTTSMSWSKMDVASIDLIRLNIYQAKVNAVIPWACIQTLTWVGGDPNPGTAIRVSEDGTYEVLRGYHYYKQVAPVGQPGMAVAAVKAPDDSGIELIAFAGNDTAHPDAFVILNKNRGARKIEVVVKNAKGRAFVAYRTSDDKDRNADAGTFTLAKGDRLAYTAPARSVTTFCAR